MKSFVISMVVAGVLAVSGCASRPDLTILQPVTVDTSSYRSFAWADGSLIREAPRAFERRSARTLEEVVAATLTAKGYTRALDPASADILVSADIVGEWTPKIGDTWHYGNPAQGVGSSVEGSSLPSPDALGARYNTYQADHVIEMIIDGAIILDVQDARSGFGVWKGQIANEVRVRGERNFRGHIDRVMARLFKDFPDQGERAD